MKDFLDVYLVQPWLAEQVNADVFIAYSDSYLFFVVSLWKTCVWKKMQTQRT